MTVSRPTPSTRWRCRQCGNLTRFDIVRTSRVTEYVHVSLAGEQTVDETHVLDEVLEAVTCRWCAGADTVDLVDRADAPAVEVPATRVTGGR